MFPQIEELNSRERSQEPENLHKSMWGNAGFEFDEEEFLSVSLADEEINCSLLHLRVPHYMFQHL